MMRTAIRIGHDDAREFRLKVEEEVCQPVATTLDQCGRRDKQLL